MGLQLPLYYAKEAGKDRVEGYFWGIISNNSQENHCAMINLDD